ncbi:methyl-accepting chemotaxis protein [Comamonas antarctica]|uniref:methyl-accepting chemotaxis protein n=1 Tax=Comamonas antarctica TaxID=2743470 RepID=UPI0028E66243|nr:methyl-accepting chemotaxis protein [Comamonas antarctica]
MSSSIALHLPRIFPAPAASVPSRNAPAASTPVAWRRSLGARLQLIFALALALGWGSAGVGLWALDRSQDALQRVIAERSAAERQVADAFWLQSRNIERLKAMALSSEPEVGDVLGAEVATDEAAYARLRQAVDGAGHGANEQALWQALDERHAAFLAASAALVAARDSGLTQRIRETVDQQFLPAAQAFTQQLQALSSHQRQAMDEAAGQAAQSAATARGVLLALCAASVLLGLWLGWALRRWIVQPLALAHGAAQRVAALDLRTDLHSRGQDEAGQMLGAMARMQASLRELVGQLQGATRHVAEASQEIARGNHDLSQRTEHGALQLQAASEHLAMLSETTTLAASAADRGQQVAQQASQSAQASGESIEALAGTIHHMAGSAQRIADITGVIDTLAFQTNLLALNAAVEAARAGEHGRGFSVVAAEVRALANRSADAAKEIKQLVQASGAQVEKSSRLATEARARTAQMLQAIAQATLSMADITRQAHGQQQDISALHAAVHALSDHAQHNAALVQESAAAALSLQDQAAALSRIATRFALPG